MREQLDKEKRETKLEFKRAQTEKKIAEEEAHQRKLEVMRTEMEESLQRIKKSTDEEKKQEEKR